MLPIIRMHIVNHSSHSLNSFSRFPAHITSVYTHIHIMREYSLDSNIQHTHHSHAHLSIISSLYYYCLPQKHQIMYDMSFRFSMRKYLLYRSRVNYLKCFMYSSVYCVLCDIYYIWMDMPSLSLKPLASSSFQ